MALQNATQTGQLYNSFLRREYHDRICFCIACRSIWLTCIPDETERSLRMMLAEQLPTERNNRLIKVFENTLQTIVYGKRYYDFCLNNTPYTSFKCWAKQQPMFRQYVEGNVQEKKLFDDFCDLIRVCEVAYTNWEMIVENLTQTGIDRIDARNFSVHMFSRATSLNWCITYNNKLKPRINATQLLYTTEQIDDIFQYILRTGILHQISYDEHMGARIGYQLQRRIVKHCMDNNQTNR